MVPQPFAVSLYDVEYPPLPGCKRARHLFQEEGCTFPNPCHGRTELMRHVRNKVSFHLVQLSQGGGHPVEGRGELTDLLGGTYGERGREFSPSYTA